MYSDWDLVFKEYPPHYTKKQILRYRFWHFVLATVPFIFCRYCFRFRLSIKKRRMRTMYDKEELNYEYSCIYCYREHDEYWKDK